MIMNPREKDCGAKKEEDPNNIKFSKISTSSSRQWSSYKNPRIVRVSRTFGGKDRHSKVCTVRGLRDRRIRLSVPTAIQLYDLQDRLGVSQPSKVVDWLLDATKNEIDKLPPLPIIPGNFASFHQTIPSSQETSSSSQSISSSLSRFLNTNQPSLGMNQTREGMVKINERDISLAGKEKWITSHQDQENQEGFGGFLAQNFLPLNNNQSPFPNLPYNSYFHWDPSNLSLSQFGGGYSFSNEDHQSQNNNILNPSIPSNSQLNLPSIIPTFPSYVTTPSMENDHNLRQINHLQQQNSVVPTTLHLITSPRKSYPLNVNSKPIQSMGNHTGERTDKDSRNS